MLKIIEPISFPSMTKHTSDNNKKQAKHSKSGSSFSDVLKKIIEVNKKY